MLTKAILRPQRMSIIRLTSTRNAHAATPSVSGHHEIDLSQVHNRVGKREIVGFGINGRPQYFDNPTFPYPSVRWSIDNAEISKLREKARGDWSTLSLEEKKTLYRADFCQTLSEATMKGVGDWKWILGCILSFVGLGLWGYVMLFKTVYTAPKLESNSLEHQARMLERMIAQGMGKVHGYSSEWDYEKGQWKK